MLEIRVVEGFAKLVEWLLEMLKVGAFQHLVWITEVEC